MSVEASSSHSLELQVEDGQESIRMSTYSIGGEQSSLQKSNLDLTKTPTEQEEDVLNHITHGRLSSSSLPQQQDGEQLESAPASLHDSRSALPAYGDEQEHTSGSVSALPPVDGGVKAWTFLALATCLESLVWGYNNAYGAYQDWHINSPQSPLHGQSSTAIAAPGTLIMAGQYCTPFLFLGLLNAFPHRIKLFSAITLTVSVGSLLIASFVPSVTGVILFQGFGAGFASGAFYTQAIFWLPQWFDKKRGLATGVLFFGSGIGGVVWPFILNTLLQNVGFQWTLRTLSLAQLVLGSLITYFLRPRLPTVAPSTTALRSADPTSRHNPLRRRRNILKQILPKHDRMIHTPVGLTYAFVQFVQNASFWSISYYIAPYCTSLGYSGSIPTALLAAFNAAAAISYVATGKLCDVLPHTLLVLLAGSTGSLLVGLLLGFARSLAPLIAFTILFGLFNGGFSCIMSPQAHELSVIGSTEHSSIFLEFMLVRGMGAVTGPLIASTLYKGQTTMDTLSSSTQSSSNNKSSIWGDHATYGSHQLGPLVIFVTVLNFVVVIISLVSIPLRKSILRSH